MMQKRKPGFENIPVSSRRIPRLMPQIKSLPIQSQRKEIKLITPSPEIDLLFDLQEKREKRKTERVKATLRADKLAHKIKAGRKK